MLLRLNRQHPPPRLPRLLAKVRRLAEGAAPQAGQPQAGAAGQATARGGGNPQDLAKSAEKGSLKSPYQDFKKVAEEGHQKFMSAGCNGFTAAAAWVRLCQTRSGSMAATTTRCSG